MKKIFAILAIASLSFSLFSQTKTGTLKIFSELTGISVYVDEVKQLSDVSTLIVPVGSHYLKVLYQNTSVYGEIIEIKENETTTILIKNTGQVQEKIMEAKTPEREEYQNSKIDVILTSNSISNTVGASNMFHGYYGFSKSVTSTTQITDFKIIKGGVQEIGERQLANLADNQAILQNMAKVEASINKQVSVGAMVFLGSLVIGTPLLIDMIGDKHFLHKNTPTHPKWEAGVLAGVLVTGTISYGITMGADKQRPAHYYKPEDANKDAQKVNKKLKEKLGLPENYDIK